MKTPGYYVYDEHGVPRPERDLDKWSRWLFGDDSHARRQIARTESGDVRVSTIFLGLDHGWEDEQPILWETMVFGGEHDELQRRCAGTREQAEAMHNSVLKEIGLEEHSIL